MNSSLWFSFYRLAEITSSSDTARHTTTELAGKLQLSQQTTSRHLIWLEKEGYITRQKETDGEIIRITETGRKELLKMYATLDRIVHPSKKQVILAGEVFSGLGEGAYYVSQLGYNEQFRKKLGFKPYPGTLNVRLDADSVKKRGVLDICAPTTIDSFSNDNRTFGSVRCCSVLLNDVAEAYVITAYRTHYGSDVLEIISSRNLRKVLRIRDGDHVTVTVPLSGAEKIS